MNRLRTPIAVVLGVALTCTFTGCSVEKKKEAGASSSPSASPSPSLPTNDVSVPAGVTLTEAGETLDFGQPATVAYQPNDQRKSVLELSVASVQQGRLADLAGYQLSDDTKKSKIYYVQVSAKNVGTGDLSRTGIPLYAVDDTNSLNQQTSFNNTFKRCPSQPLPAGFTAGKSISTCLVYVLRPGQTMTEVSYRPLQAFPPITWKGTIAAPAKKKKQG